MQTFCVLINFAQNLTGKSWPNSDILICCFSIEKKIKNDREKTFIQVNSTPTFCNQFKSDTHFRCFLNISGNRNNMFTLNIHVNNPIIKEHKNTNNAY